MSGYPHSVLAQYPCSPSTDPASDTVAVSTQFTQTLEPVQPVSPGSQFSLHLNAGGRLDLYTVGTDQEVFRLRRLVGGDADYERKALNFKASQLNTFASDAVQGEDEPDIFGIGADGSLTLARYEQETKEYVQQRCQPTSATEKLSQFTSVKLNDSVYAFVRFDDGTIASNFINMKDLGWASNQWVPLLSPNGTENAKATRISVCHNNKRQNGIYAISDKKSVWFSDSRNRFSRFTDLGYLEVRDVTIIEDFDNLLNIVAIGHIANKPAEKSGIWVKRQKKYPSTPGAIEWEDWNKIQSTVDVEGKAIRSSLDESGKVTIFVMEDDTESRLFIIRELRDKKNRTGWTHPFPLGNKVPDAIFAIAQDAQDLAEAFSITTEADADGNNKQMIYRFWQDPDSTLWKSETLSVEKPDTVVTLPVHSVEVRLQNGQQDPLSFGEAYFSSPTPATLRLNGRSYPVGPLIPEVKLKSDAGGLLVISYITNSLAAPTLVLRLPGMSPDEAISIEPNAQLQDRLSTLTSDDILKAKNSTGVPILPGTGNERKENAKALAEIHETVMSLGKPSDGSSVKAPYVWDKPGLGVRYHQRARNEKIGRLDLSQVQEQHWKITFADNNGIRVGKITADEGLALYNRAANMKISALTANDNTGALDLFDFSLGDLWQSIKSGVGKIFSGLKEIIITTIIDPIKKIVSAVKTVFKLVLEGIEYLIEKTIEYIQQAFEFIESMWAKVKAFFNDLYEWLAFLFNFDDIKRSAEIVEHMTDVGVDFSILATKHVRGLIEVGLDTISDRVKTAMGQFAKEISGQSLKQSIEKEQTVKGKNNAQKYSAHNPVSNAFRYNYDRAKAGPTSLISNSETKSTLQKILVTLDSLAQNFEFGDGKQAFEEAVSYFTEIGKSPDDMINLAMAGLVKVFESLALTTIALARGVILSIIDLMIKMIDVARVATKAQFEIPILSPIYKFITGRELAFSLAGMVSVLVAVPFTVGYKASTKTAPFANQSAVDKFKKAYTAETLAKMAGFIVKKDKLVKAAKKTQLTIGANIIKKMKTCSFAVFIVRAIVEPVQVSIVGAKSITSMDTLDVIAQLIGGANVLLRLASSIFSAPWFNKENAGSPGCTTGSGYGQIVWMMQLVLGPFLGIVIFVASILSDGKTTTKVNISRLTLWGMIHFGLNIIGTFMGSFDKENNQKNGLAIARAIITPIGTQCSWALLYDEVIKGSKGISVVVAAGLTFAVLAADAVFIGLEVFLPTDEVAATAKLQTIPLPV